jgi:hypothetical protein
MAMAIAMSRSGRMIRVVVAWIIIALSVPVGVLPGPGGIFVFAFGAALLLRHSLKAKRLYVTAEHRWPKLGRFLNKALRRGPRPRIDSAAALT